MQAAGGQQLPALPGKERLMANEFVATRPYGGDVSGKWEDVTPVFEDGDLRVAHIRTETDRLTLGGVMGHCAGQHKRWERMGVWQFFAVLDKGNVPHNTIHTRDVIEPPEDSWTKDPLYCSYGFRTYDRDGGWEPIATYLDHDKTDITDPEPERGSVEWYAWRTKWNLDKPRPKGQVPMLFDGRQIVILSCTGRGLSAKNPYVDTTVKWYESLKIPDAAPVPITSVSRR